MAKYHKGDSRYRGFSFNGEGLKVTVIKRPDHGRLGYEKDTFSNEDLFHYTPDTGYTGQDRFVMQVEKNGVKVRINYLIEAVRQDERTAVRGDDGWQMLYCNPESWKIAQTTTDTSADNLAAWQRASDLATLVATASTSITGFADLPGSAVGNTA